MSHVSIPKPVEGGGGGESLSPPRLPRVRVWRRMTFQTTVRGPCEEGIKLKCVLHPLKTNVSYKSRRRDLGHDLYLLQQKNTFFNDVGIFFLLTQAQT